MDLRDVIVQTAHLDEEAHLRGLLDEGESLRARTIADSVVRARFVVSRGLRRRLLSGCTGIPADHLKFRELAGGKPCLARVEGWDFNLSHAGDYVVVAAGRGQVGVDLEKIRPVRAMEAIVTKYFSRDEARAWRFLPEGAKQEGFFVLWSAREATMKCAGLGLARGVAVTRVDPAILSAGEVAATAGLLPLRLLRRTCPAGYVLILAAASGGS